MAKATRVFEIAKELNIPSKVIVEKCQAEGVPGITNHMSVVKLGLMQTIREWFSDGAQGSTATAVEVAAPVDLDQVKVRRKARRKDEAEDTAAESEAPAAEEVAAEQQPAEAPALSEEEPVATVTVEEVAAAVRGKARKVERVEEPAEQEPQGTTVEPPAEAPAEAPTAAVQAEPVTPPAASVPAVAAKAKPVVEKPAAVEKPAEEVRPVGTVNVPVRPEVVKPVGERLKPKVAQLRGPQVVRVEKADPIAEPRRRPAGGGPGRGPGGGGSAGGTDDGGTGITRSRGPVRGRGAGAGAGAGAVREPERAGRPNKRRSQSARRGRSADSLQQARGSMSEQDLIELDARLKGAPGYVKQRRRNLKTRGNLILQAQRSPADVGGRVEIAEPITIKALSAATGIKSTDIIKWLFSRGVMATINSAIDTEAAMEVALEYDIELAVKEQVTAEAQVVAEFENREAVDTRKRPPVVTVLGHVDHGKTSLLDRIRKADVAAHEHGGITQHVGAYRVTVAGSDGQEKSVVFLDTPGHEAFTSMRSRGAQLTDLVVLVVAADDGVMPQTVESINHARAAGVPVVVALNKIDRPEASTENIQKIYGQLAEHGLNPVEWGGETEVVRTSAITGQGVTELLDVLDYQAELLELSADYGGSARGTVIEAEMQPGRGSVARVLVQQGTLRVGDFIVIGRAFGRVRDMTDAHGKSLREAGPATPVELSGIDEVPDAGDKFYSTLTLQKAEEVAQHYREQERQRTLATKTKVTLDNFAQTLQAGETNFLRVVLKADVQGSIDVLRKSLEGLGNKEVAVRVLHAAVGGITESDVLLADASEAIIVGFHVGITPAVREIAEERQVEVRLYNVIYDLTDEVKKALEGMLKPETREEQLGTAEVREVFKISKLGSIAGCLVTEGSIVRSGKVRVIRNGIVVTDNRSIESLRRVKDDVREVRAGTECGIRVAGYDDLKNGDQIVCYNVQTVARKLA